MEFTLGKSERLGKGDFRAAKWTKSGRTDHFLLFKRRNPNPIEAKRFGVILRRKIKGAVNRNRARRLLKEFFRLNKPLFENAHDYYIRIEDMPQHLRLDYVSTEVRLLLSRTGNEKNRRHSTESL